MIHSVPPGLPVSPQDSRFLLHLRQRRTLEAVVRGGRNQLVGDAACGDALLIHPTLPFFAVADSPERCPDAAGRILEQSAAVLEKLFPAAGHKEGHGGGGFCCRDWARIREEINRLIRAAGENQRTTFTALFLAKAERGGDALLLHNGDSLFYHFQILSGSCRQVSVTNHWLAGKADSIFQQEVIRFSEDSRFVLATDGFLDIIRRIREVETEDAFGILLAALAAASVEDAASCILDRFDADPGASDDLALIVLDPNRAAGRTRPCSLRDKGVPNPGTLAEEPDR